MALGRRLAPTVFGPVHAGGDQLNVALESDCKSAATQQTGSGLEWLIYSSLPSGRANRLFQAVFLTR
jgi:hypothetical protein